MFRKMLLGAMAFMATSAGVVIAGPKEDLSAAVQKLADSPSYSFSTTSANAGGGRGFGGGATSGKVQKDGYTTFSGAMGQNNYEVYIKGDKAVVKTEDGWQLASDLAKPDPNGGGGGFNPNMFLAMRAQSFKSPAAQAKDLVDKVGDVTSADDALSASLPADSVKELVSFRPRNADANMPAPDISNPSGSVKFWVKDGVLSKMELHVKATVSFNGNDRDVDRTTTTEIKDVGSTTVDVPDDAKAKLGN